MDQLFDAILPVDKMLLDEEYTPEDVIAKGVLIIKLGNCNSGSSNFIKLFLHLTEVVIKHEELLIFWCQLVILYLSLEALEFFLDVIIEL